MGRRAVILVWAMLIIVVLTVLLGSFSLTAMNENTLVKRYDASARAFWLAEAGLAEALANMPNDVSGVIGDSRYTYSVNTQPLSGFSDYYEMTSTGAVVFSGGSVSRVVSAVARTVGVDTANFQHAIRTTVALDVQGSVDITGDIEENASLDFPDLFGITKAEMEVYASTVYNDPVNNIMPVEGITWVNVSEGEEFRVSISNWEGSGLLIVNGNVRISGGSFDGILYVTGELRITGNPIINGSILVESDTEVVEDTAIQGNVTINYDEQGISVALDPLSFLFPEVVSWRE